MLFICPRCKYTTDKYSNLYRHYYRKSKCETLYENISINECIKELLKKNKEASSSNIICEYCKKEFKEQRYLIQHKNRYGCKVENRITKENFIKDLFNENKFLKQEKEYIKKGNNTKLYSYGEENIEYIFKEDILDTIRGGINSGILKLLKQIYFNKEYSENQIIKIINKDECMIYEEKQWNIKKNKIVIEQIVSRIYGIIKKSIKNTKNKKYLYFIENFEKRNPIFINKLYKNIEKELVKINNSFIP